MAAWREEISLRVLKNISLFSCAHSWNIFLTREEEFRISKRPCNILYKAKSSVQRKTFITQEIVKYMKKNLLIANKFRQSLSLLHSRF